MVCVVKKTNNPPLSFFGFLLSDINNSMTSIFLENNIPLRYTSRMSF